MTSGTKKSINTSNHQLTRQLVEIISETNGISLAETLTLLLSSTLGSESEEAVQIAREFSELLGKFQINQISIEQLLRHPFSDSLAEFFRKFPLRYNEEHIHLSGSLTPEFIYPRMQRVLNGPNGKALEAKLVEVYGERGRGIDSVERVRELVELQPGQGFTRYLLLLYLPKLILIDREAHAESAYHLATELYTRHNVGLVRLKFMFSRASTVLENIPGAENLTAEDVVLGLYDGFSKFKSEHPEFSFVLSPSFRKEASFFDSTRYATRREHFMAQVDSIIKLIEDHPELGPVLTEVDTVGNETELYRKSHFQEMAEGLRKLQFRGFKIRSHHGEIWKTLNRGIQAVDNAMNIWHIDTLEHGISLGVNPNFYFHRLFQRVLAANHRGSGLEPGSLDCNEIAELSWGEDVGTRDKLLNGEKLGHVDITAFTRAKFMTAREVEHYQHDVLNRLIAKDVTLNSLPSSNNKLTGLFEDYKDHPFSWWEKKGVQLGVGTDNYVTLKTNFIEEMLILLYSDPQDLKITKLLMVTTGETRRPYLSHLLWKMRRSYEA